MSGNASTAAAAVHPRQRANVGIDTGVAAIMQPSEQADMRSSGRRTRASTTAGGERTLAIATAPTLGICVFLSVIPHPISIVDQHEPDSANKSTASRLFR